MSFRPPCRYLHDIMRAIALTGLVVASCGPAPVSEVLSGGDDPVTSGTTADTTSNASTTTTSTTSTTASSSASWSSSTSGTWPAEDVGAPTTGDVSGACAGKVDVIFVMSERISNSAQMDEAIPAFAAIMQEEFSELDLHVMVLDPDGEWGDSLLCPKNMCPADGGCPVEPEFPCWALHDEDALTKCDNTMGAGVVFPAGQWTMNKPCGLETGHRFVTGDDPDFAERFTCLAQYGNTAGGSNSHGVALGQALTWNLRLGCNEGFLRDDALLMAVQIVSSNYDDDAPFVVAEKVLEAKNNEQDLVVALAITRGWKSSQMKPLCDTISVKPEGLAAWAFHFDHHVFGSLCAPSYVPFFAEAAAMAADLCRPIPR